MVVADLTSVLVTLEESDLDLVVSVTSDLVVTVRFDLGVSVTTDLGVIGTFDLVVSGTSDLGVTVKLDLGMPVTFDPVPVVSDLEPSVAPVVQTVPGYHCT